MLVQPISSCIHLPGVQIDAELDVADGFYDIVVELRQPLFIVSHAEFIRRLAPAGLRSMCKEASR